MEGGSPSCCAAARGSTIRTTPAPPSGTATTRTMSTPTLASVPAVSPPQHPSPSEPLEGIPAGAPEGSRPAPVIGDNRRYGLPLTHDRTIRTASAHCPTAPATWVTRWAFAALTPTTAIPRPAAVASPGLACVSSGAAVVLRALLVEGLARPVAGSGSCCFRRRGCCSPESCLLRPAVQGAGPPLLPAQGASPDDPVGITAIGRSAS
jgi:hypothetical protein